MHNIGVLLLEFISYGSPTWTFTWSTCWCHFTILLLLSPNISEKHILVTTCVTCIKVHYTLLDSYQQQFIQCSIVLLWLIRICYSPISFIFILRFIIIKLLFLYRACLGIELFIESLSLIYTAYNFLGSILRVV